MLYVKFLVAVLMMMAMPLAVAGENLSTLEMNAVGEVQIAPDGHVSGYLLKSKLTPEIAELVERHVRTWRFEPIVVDGKQVIAKTALHLVLKAEPVAGKKDDYAVRILNVRFGEPQRNPQMKPPRYPYEAVRVGLGAKVLLSVRLDETGTVVDVSAYQTNLNAKPSSEGEANHWREVFERASIAAARNWHFALSETINGKSMGTTALIPIVYWVKDGPIRNVAPGEWQPYLPGPVHPTPWLNSEQLADNHDSSSLKDGQALSLDSHFRLKDAVIGRIL
jgi:hypothetical protein